MSATPAPRPLDRIEREFWAFHFAHPEVYDALRALALRVKRKGKAHYSIKALYETLRLSSILSFEGFWIHNNGGHPKDTLLNNNYTALYARLLMQQEPKLKGFFQTRARYAPGAPRQGPLEPPPPEVVPRNQPIRVM